MGRFRKSPSNLLSLVHTSEPSEPLTLVASELNPNIPVCTAMDPVTDLNFDPLVLPAGIAPSDDPLLSARSAVYSRSFTRRAGESRQPSAITPAEVRKGG